MVICTFHIRIFFSCKDTERLFQVAFNEDRHIRIFSGKDEVFWFKGFKVNDKRLDGKPLLECKKSFSINGMIFLEGFYYSVLGDLKDEIRKIEYQTSKNTFLKNLFTCLPENLVFQRKAMKGR